MTQFPTLCIGKLFELRKNMSDSLCHISKIRNISGIGKSVAGSVILKLNYAILRFFHLG